MTDSAAAAPARELVLDMRGITKSFPGVHALRNVDISVSRGEILGLVGENGAGKSTLVKILAGAYARDAGVVRVADEIVQSANPQKMIERGVAVIYQEPSLADHLSTAENIFMGRLPKKRFGIIDWAQLDSDTAALSRQLGMDLHPRTQVGTLSVARRQMVEIAKALSRDAQLIVLDEPSAVLGDAELEGLFAVMRRLADDGVAFVYISHRLNEVFAITDRVTVMKDGQVVTDEATATLTPQRLVRLMVGRDVASTRIEREATPGVQDALVVRGLVRTGVLHGIDLTVRKGEILGIAGLAGSGRTEVLRAIHGADPIDAGEIEILGQPVRISSPRDAIAHGIGLLTEDRKADGLLLAQSVSFNTTITKLRDLAPWGVIGMARERQVVRDYVDRLSVRPASISATARNLSGGNQQKVIFAKWLHADCKILLIDEPTRGVDVGAKREIWQLLADLASRGVAIVMVSSELPEILAISDRILVMREGRVTIELTSSEATEEGIMRHATRHDG
ncbi:MAG TPA: sugar ABC transporter ATP-binding protein [Euzebya sp.]|nr:sugar ABC transporter ATP-binding protein [Euzebya sp.]